MSSDVLAHAGEPFFTTKGPDRGMGLGLFLCRTVVEGIGGQLTLTSVPEQGTTATVVLPLSAGEISATDRVPHG
jgi:signal transduction histidine kinase